MSPSVVKPVISISTFCVLKEPNKDIQKLLKPSSSGDLSKEVFHSLAGEEEEAEGGLPGHTASLLHISERRREYSEGAKRRWKERRWMEGPPEMTVEMINGRRISGI